MSVLSTRRLSKVSASIGALAILCPTGMSAQNTGSISGQVVDALTREPISDVIVSVVGSALSSGTDAEGFYTIDSVLPGLVKVKAQILGYVPITTDYYTVQPDSSVPVDFHLAPVLYELEGVEVTGQSPQRTWARHQGAVVLKKEDIPQHGDILSALQGLVPAVRVRGRRDDTRMVVRNAEADVLYVVDGSVIRPPLTFYIDAAQVDCVEIRRGFSAVVQFKPSIVGENYSGVVLIWTRGALGPRPRDCVPGG
ncbi:MAG: carboxypeptidase regulatory-like domain-containing protein [Gemmatimonadota bacterium]|nr:MAG: carboxypeptidase regulatory-like domain-containing protein [Gemmatimonadota bacterium]